VRSRREILAGLGTALIVPLVHAEEARPTGAAGKLLQNRTELWANYAKRTKNLMARLTTTRETSLLDEPLVVTGALVFEAPHTLVLRDDGLTGSTTFVDPDRVVVAPNQSELPRGPALDPARMPAARWLGDRLLAMFAPGEPDALIADARVNVPKGKGYRIEVLPPRGSAARQVIRSITLHLDPVAGAVTQLLIAEAQGDRLLLQITDHRQNVDDADVQRVIASARDLVGSA
jgi:hypothetical protein